ncbi:glycosyltransferase family 2 protein [Bizionia sp.]|uniref:glycosyltransferase family 2 protein n=1 Tax=Bizionia sp. TaxID=1954480 RepID=UPI003A8D4ED1
MGNQLVSICIPTYNGAAYLQEALESVNKQTYSPLEIIVSDDSSLDQTLAIIDQYKENTNIPVFVFKHVPDGIGSNWNNTIKMASGDYIKFLFQDDLLEPDCIQEMVQVFNENPDLGLVCVKRHILVDLQENGFRIETWMQDYQDLQLKLNLNYTPVGIITKRFFKSQQFLKAPTNIIGEPSAVMFPREILKTIGFFREDMKQLLDVEFWYRILKRRNIAVINKKLISFRIHDNQATQRNKHSINNDWILLNKLLYKDYFLLLNWSRQKQLFLQFNFIGKIIKKILL